MTEILAFATRHGGRQSFGSAELEELELSLTGEIVTPARPEYEQARRVWNGLIDRRPAAIVRCASSTDVSLAVRRGEVYLNFPGFAEEGPGFMDAAYGDNLGRLRSIKAKYDPDNLFRGNFNISP